MKWSEADTKFLELYYDEHSPIRIAQELNKTEDSVVSKIRRLGLKKTEFNDTIKERILISEFYSLLSEKVKTDYKIKRFPNYNLSSKNKSLEILNLIISDVHIGKINEWYDTETHQKIITYDDSIRKKFIQKYLEGIIRLLSLWNNGYFFEKLNIFFLGDIIDNDRIFDGHKTSITLSAGQQIWEACAEFVDIIGILSGYFPEIKVVGIVGNHGRSVSNSKEEEPIYNNFEYHLYKIMALMLSANKKVNFTIPESKFYSVNNYKHRIFMSHGETIRGSTTSYAERKAKELLINLPYGYNLYAIGHRHRSDRIALSPNSEMLINGCVTGDTKILMEDFTEKQISDIKLGDSIYGFDTQKRGITLKPTAVMELSVHHANVGSLIFDNGQKINITNYHPIYSYEKQSHINSSFIWKFPHEPIKTVSIYSDIGERNKEWQIGYLKGFIDGDGTIGIYNKKLKIHLYNKNIDLLECIRSILFNFHIECNLNKNGKGVYAIQLHNKKAEKLQTIIKQQEINLNFMRGYLAGIFDAEGNYSKSVISIFNTNKTIIEQISDFCSALKIHNHTNSPKNRGNYKPLYITLISPAFNFFIKCQPFSKNKVMSYCLTNHPNKEFIEKQNYVGKEKALVYNLETDLHTYIANGIPVHNCFIPYDDYSFRLYGTSTQPSQWCFGSSERRVISSLCVPIDFKGSGF